MPRVENNGANVTNWCLQTGNGSSTHDVCNACYKSIQKNPHVSSLKPYNGDPLGDQGWWGEIEHPSYSGDDYTCEVCDKKLTYRDN